MSTIKEITSSIIAVAIVAGAIYSLFITVDVTGSRVIQSLATLILGYYFGAKTLPLMGTFGKSRK